MSVTRKTSRDTSLSVPTASSNLAPLLSIFCVMAISINWLSPATAYATENLQIGQAEPAASRVEKAPDCPSSDSIPLFEAIIKNEQSTFMFFFDLMADTDINQQGSDGKTALHHAVLHATDLVIIDLLLARGIDINRPDKDGNTALHCVISALKNSKKPLSDSLLQFSIILHLIERGVVLTTLKNNVGQTVVDLFPINFAHQEEVNDLSIEILKLLRDVLNREKTLRVLFAFQLISEFSGGGLTSREKLILKSFLVQVLIKKKTVTPSHKKCLLVSLAVDCQLRHEKNPPKRHAIVKRALNKLNPGEFLWLTVSTKNHSMDGCFQKYNKGLYYTTANSGDGLEKNYHSVAETKDVYKTSFSIKIENPRQVDDLTEYFISPLVASQNVSDYYKFIEDKLGAAQIDQRRVHKDQLSDNCVTQGMLAMVDYLRDNNVNIHQQTPLLFGDDCDITEEVLDFLISHTPNQTIQNIRESYKHILAIDRSFEEVKKATKPHEKVCAIVDTHGEIARLGHSNPKIYKEFAKNVLALITPKKFFSNGDANSEDEKKCIGALFESLGKLNELLADKAAACSRRPDITEKDLDLSAKIEAFKNHIAELQQLVTNEEKNSFSAKWYIVFALEGINKIVSKIDSANLKEEEKQEIKKLVKTIKALVKPVYEQGNNPHEDTALTIRLHYLFGAISRYRIQDSSASPSTSSDCGLTSPVSRSVDTAADDDN